MGGRHYSETLNKVVVEKVNSRTGKLIQVIRGTCGICGRNKSQILSK